ncbi:MAG TPA: hypothetical protein DCZ75_15350 [Geobacter sp.]|nr:hypothetical protein [Geobacter sp.]
MFKAVSRYVVKAGAVGVLLGALLAISTILATASVADAAVSGSVTSTHWKTSSGEGYTLNFAVPDESNISTVTLTSGPGVTAPVQLTLLDAEVSTELTAALELTNAPAVGDNYTLNVTYGDTTAPQDIIVSVNGVIAPFAAPAAPLGAVVSSANPTFTWSAPSTPPAGSYSYQVSISGSDGSWKSSAIDSATTSYQFASSTFSPSVAPTAGVVYEWTMAVRDANGNRSENRASFVLGANFQGKVTDLAGNGISGVAVYVYTTAKLPIVHDTVLTQADGSYVYGGLSAASYKVAFSQTSSMIWYNNKFSYEDGDLVAVSSGAITSSINAVIDSWGAISGKATTSAGSGISGAKAELYDTNGALVASVPSVTTKTDGTFLFSLVPPGSYKIKLTGLPQGYTEQWAFSGNAVTVTAGNTTEVYPTVMPSLNFSGKVTDVDGSPVAGIWVYLYSDKSGTFANFGGAQTQADGSYVVGGMASGSYYVMFDTTGTSFQKQYYNRKASLSLADAVVVGSTALTNVNAVVGTGRPVITTFTAPSTSASFSVTGITLTAVEGNGVAGYLLTESSTAPDAGATGWSATAPTSYRFTSIGEKTLYAWAKGSTGLVSTSAQASVTISASAMKTGDCDGSGSVTIAEVQSAINMYLGIKPVEQCVDQDNSGAASIAEVQKTINSFLGL